MSSFAPGRVVLERYELVMPLGRTDAGSVFLARAEGADGSARPVAVKLIPHELLSEDQDEREFGREARLLSELRPPNMVQTIDFGDEGDLKVLVVEYVHGFDLSQWHRFLAKRGRARIPLQQALHIAIRILTPIHHLHGCEGNGSQSHQVLHNDVRLSNVLVSQSGQALLADYLFSKGSEDPSESSARLFQGKTAYAAPELLRGDSATPGSDCYAVAVLLFKLLAGREPFFSTVPARAILNTLQAPPPRLADLRPDVPPALDDVLAKALAKSVRHRFKTAADLAAALALFRTMDDAEVEAELAKAVRKDFPDLAAEWGIPSLEDRDKAWLAPNPSGTGSSSLSALPHEHLSQSGIHAFVPPPVGLGAAEPSPVPQTLPIGDRRSTRLVARRPRRTALVLSISVVGVAVAAMATLPLWRTHPSAGLNLHAGSVVAGSPGADESPLVRAVRDAGPRYRHCFAADPSGTQLPPELVLRFELPAGGTHAHAFLEPETSAHGPLEACVLETAKDHAFPAQPHDETLRVPLRQLAFGGE